MEGQSTHTGSCHCGKVRFQATGDMRNVISCNCSICSRTGSLLAFVPAAHFELLSGHDALSDYQFAKKAIHHLFCSNCGVRSFGRGALPDGTPMVAVNVRCLEGIDLDALNVQRVDGRSF